MCSEVGFLLLVFANPTENLFIQTEIHSYWIHLHHIYVFIHKPSFSCTFFLFWCLFKYYFLAFRQCYIPPIQGKYIIWQICLHIFYIYCWELWIHVSHQFLWRNLAKCIRNLSFLSQPTSPLKIIFRWFLGFSRHIIMVVNSLQPQVCPRFIPQLPRW